MFESLRAHHSETNIFTDLGIGGPLSFTCSPFGPTRLSRRTGRLAAAITAMFTHFPPAVPEIPVSNVDKAAEYYVNVLGFQFDWGDDAGGIGGISQGDSRIFLTNTAFREHYGTGASVMVWLNLNSRQEVDELYDRWKQAGARIVAEPEDKPWHLREFRVADLDGDRGDLAGHD